jgi:hypothetical protein
MLRLIKLAVFTLVGYAIYEFVRGMMDGMPTGSQAKGGQQGGGAQAQPAGGQRPRRADGQTSQPALSSSPEPRSPLMGGSSEPQGMRVATQDRDGGSITETVGRGVIPQR